MSDAFQELLARATRQPLWEQVENTGQSEGEEPPTYDRLMDLLRRLEDQPWPEPEPVHPHVREVYREILADAQASALDVFEVERRDGETRAQAKTRIMLEAYSLEGSPIRDTDLWRLRAQYVWIKSYVQGRGQGLRYDTDNWVHFYNRYGMGGQDPEYMIGLRKSTVQEMMRRSMIESQSLWAMRLLGH
ncbi:hypothetical protein SEA_ZUKO_59 [Streptomyces phage Zuko]|uniref:Uncharacterized protein n=1 Tax=Streptomyces phage Zuko TaxID=2601695 RepID=A0A5J6D751_9CAUD|nr:hypothetical protein PP630_gp059 [Streptomyces phage Zuko]QEQ93637.1 hypothetical protein SEA_ZUKO_59 [Streptomyces phage Zuko]